MIPEIDKKRFWSMVDIREPDECWPWLGNRVRGYGKFQTLGGFWFDVPSVATGTDRPDLLTWHTCLNKLCCNPDHIGIGTREEKRKSGHYVAARCAPVPKLTKKEKRRFWSKVDIREPDECWPWLGYLYVGRPYGQFYINGVSHRATRIAYSLNTGHNCKGLLVCHSCDNPPCVNPNHLWLGADVDNYRDMANKGRSNAKLTVVQVREIRDRASRGQSVVDLARLYPVSARIIWSVVNRRTWKHI